jgi:hypothetical protein
VKDAFLASCEEMLPSPLIQHKIVQAFDMMQILLGITHSIFGDFFQFNP